MKKILSNPGWGNDHRTKWIDKEKSLFIWHNRELSFEGQDESNIYCYRCDRWLVQDNGERYKI